MASFYDTTVGQQVEFQRVLARAGFTEADIARIIKEPSLATAMYVAIQPIQPMVTRVGPSWWRTPEQQLARARYLWPGLQLPKPPERFTPRTKFEVLLLHVPDNINSLWGRVVPPEGYTKDSSDEADKRILRLSPFKRESTEPVWLAFDPEFGRGMPPVSLWGHPSLAASEVFSALIQFPEWPLAWLNGAAAPNLSGYQLRYDNDWSGVLYFDLWNGARRLRLDDDLADTQDDGWASPKVREMIEL